MTRVVMFNLWPIGQRFWRSKSKPLSQTSSLLCCPPYFTTHLPHPRLYTYKNILILRSMGPMHAHYILEFSPFKCLYSFQNWWLKKNSLLSLSFTFNVITFMNFVMYSNLVMSRHLGVKILLSIKRIFFSFSYLLSVFFFQTLSSLQLVI